MPFVHVRDVRRSAEFYAHFGFEVHHVDPGPIVPGAPGPGREFRVDDPDGYCVMVTDAEALDPPA